MKKTMIVLMMVALVLGSVFADDPTPTSSIIQVQSTVAKVFPVVSFKAGSTVGGSTAVTHDSEQSIALEDVTVEFVISQAAGTRYSGNIYFSVAAAPLTHSDNPTSYFSDGPTVVTTETTLESTSDNYVEVSPATVAEGDVFKITAAYTGFVSAAVDLATFTLKWPKKATLPDGLYSANVTMTYTAP